MITKHKNYTVASLRQEGYKVSIRHVRDMEVIADFENMKFIERLAPKGGMTLATVESPEGKIFTGVANTSRKDHYNKKLGVAIALGRAMRNENR